MLLHLWHSHLSVEPRLACSFQTCRLVLTPLRPVFGSERCLSTWVNMISVYLWHMRPVHWAGALG